MTTTRSLMTDWKRIGRSGPTVDGRTIDPQMLLDAAETYDKEKFTALIWPDHYHWINYGLVEQLKAEKNTEGGVDLFAILSPNRMYLDANSMGQRLFLSMELLPDFAKSGKTYLTGLAATDDPASLGTSEMRFSNEGKKAGIFCSKYQEVDLSETNVKIDAEDLSLLSRLSAFFSKQNSDEETTMADKAELEKLRLELKTLQDEFAKLKPAEPEGKQPEDALVKLTQQVADLTAQVTQLTEDKAKADAEKTTAEIITKLSSQVDDLTTKLSKALNEASGGTQAGEHKGGEGEADKFAGIY